MEAIAPFMAPGPPMRHGMAFGAGVNAAGTIRDEQRHCQAAGDGRTATPTRRRARRHEIVSLSRRRSFMSKSLYPLIRVSVPAPPQRPFVCLADGILLVSIEVSAPARCVLFPVPGCELDGMPGSKRLPSPRFLRGNRDQVPAGRSVCSRTRNRGAHGSVRPVSTRAFGLTFFVFADLRQPQPQSLAGV